MSRNIIAIIQARTGSSRLFGKVLRKISNKTVIEHIYNRVSSVKSIKKTFLATTILENDIEIIKICSKKKIPTFIGSVNDVLDRYYQLSKLIKPSHIVRITADCPVIDPKIIKKVINVHLKGNYDYTCNTMEIPYPDGQDVEIFKFSSLKKAWLNARLASEREHVTPYIKFNEKLFKIKKIFSKKKYSNFRWTLDEKEDLKLIKIFYNKLYKKNKFFGMKEILDLIQKNKKLTSINSMHIREEGYANSLLNDYYIKT
jgi:spore coat polysaccharide biosynthesis protein SpsF